VHLPQLWRDRHRCLGRSRARFGSRASRSVVVSRFE
jgi:hypothetical protein